ncbi:hypothetical protein AXG93_1913s2010 [Marchantia polymorpha subsp. ruderalis]|uniref:Uncharacterized protein n=1 Tax=Marchantia polymorpha subsp. ruderalis TaxID=1480154 RepID=A0A176WJ95_MARPO|nr:hypothetical protein AXG93_1913s2010 [Marchantia polymorpha subsp. ruderalis]
MDKNQTKGVELRGNPMLWRIEHWTKMMGPCAGSDGDLLFEKSSVRLTRIEEFSYGPLFSFGRKGTNRKLRTRARPKKRANQELVATEVSDSSVEKTVAPIDSVVPLLKYLDEKREKYAVSNELGKADMRLQESQRRMEKAEEAYRHLQDETTDGLKLRLEKCLNGFAMWGLQMVKWLKLDLLKWRLMSAKTSEFAGHKQIVELVNTFSE